MKLVHYQIPIRFPAAEPMDSFPVGITRRGPGRELSAVLFCVPGSNRLYYPFMTGPMIPTSPAARPERPAKPRILVVDDEEMVAFMLAELLKLLGYEPIVCNDPLRALAMLEENDYDLVLSDFRMPEMDGREFYQTAVARNPTLAKRIIFLTGDTKAEDVADFLSSSGALYLGKPFELTAVRRTVTQALAARGVGVGRPSNPANS